MTRQVGAGPERGGREPGRYGLRPGVPQEGSQRGQGRRQLRRLYSEESDGPPVPHTCPHIIIPTFATESLSLQDFAGGAAFTFLARLRSGCGERARCHMSMCPDERHNNETCTSLPVADWHNMLGNTRDVEWCIASVATHPSIGQRACMPHVGGGLVGGLSLRITTTPAGR